MRLMNAASLAAVLSASFALADDIRPSPLDAALSLVPKDAIAFVVVPSAKRASDDLQQCIERMDRPEAALGGRPIDQLKAMLGISVSFDDKGTVAIAALAAERDAEQPRFLLFLPTTDADAFLKGNLTALPNVATDAFQTKSGLTVYAKPAGAHVIVSNDPVALHEYVAGEGVGPAVRARLGERGAQLLAKGDVIAWAGNDALESFLGVAAKQSESQMPEGVPFADQARAMQARAFALMKGIQDGLVVADIDALGLGVRTFARFSPMSELAALTVGGTSPGRTMNRLPAQPFYLAFRMDVQGLGGIAAVEKLLKQIPGEPALPAWLAGAKSDLNAVQFAVYPSKLGIAAGGVLNDALLFIESEKPDVVRGGIRDAILATKSDSGGIRREPTWDADRTLKSGESADAFEVTETVTATGDAGELGVRRAISQAIFGSRGFVGFVKRAPGGIAMTFSQRADVLDRAMKIGTVPGANGKSLAEDGTLKSYRSWLIEKADVEGYIGVGQFGKMLQQLAAMVPGGDQATLPQIPTSVEPVAFAMEIDQGTVETALVMPSGVLGLFFDAAKRQVRGAIGPKAEAPATAPAASGKSE